MVPISFEIRPAARLVYVKCTGVVSLEEILRYETVVVTDAEFDAEYIEVLDLRTAERLEVSRDEVARIVGYEKNHERYIGKRKVAFIAPADLEFGLGRMYEMMEHESPMETQVFRNIDTACEWTGLSPADLEVE
jgi:hypothetical protein